MLRPFVNRIRIALKYILDRDDSYLHADVPLSSETYHREQLIRHGNHAGRTVLEIGSREVTGKSNVQQLFANAKYVGFDFYPGRNVDVVGDAHKLSRYFNDQFDVIYSYVVFEHLAMPWVAAVEMAKCLKVGLTDHFNDIFFVRFVRIVIIHLFLSLSGY